MSGVTVNGRYLIQSQLGQGGKGAVFQARECLLERDVAIEVVSDVGIGSEGRERLLKEARAAAHAGAGKPRVCYRSV